jgi:linoleoyl-CoA desaturase
MQKIRFLPEPADGFYLTLKARVREHFNQTGKNPYANTEAILKAIFFSAAFLSFYLIIISVTIPLAVFLFCWFAMGIFLILSAMSMVHDAAHGMFSKRPIINTLLLHFANLVGGDGYMYKYKHTVSHHPYTNICGYDIDLEQSKVVKVTPYSKTSAKHKFQGAYMKLLYPFFILFWVLLRDFKYYKLEKIGGSKAHHHKIHWLVLIISKLFYLFYMLVLPIWICDLSSWKVITGFLCMHLGSGLVAMFALLANHAVEDSVFILPDETMLINSTWGEHQLRTTDDYSPDSKIISFFFSGLNHHVAHHLFPKYCHIHYPAITKIVRQTAIEFGLRYRYNSITGGLASHFRLLKSMSPAKISLSE